MLGRGFPGKMKIYKHHSHPTSSLVWQTTGRLVGPVWASRGAETMARHVALVNRGGDRGVWHQGSWPSLNVMAQIAAVIVVLG